MPVDLNLATISLPADEFEIAFSLRQLVFIKLAFVSTYLYFGKEFYVSLVGLVHCSNVVVHISLKIVLANDSSRSTSNARSFLRLVIFKATVIFLFQSNSFTCTFQFLTAASKRRSSKGSLSRNKGKERWVISYKYPSLLSGRNYPVFLGFSARLFYLGFGRVIQLYQTSWRLRWPGAIDHFLPINFDRGLCEINLFQCFVRLEFNATRVLRNFLAVTASISSKVLQTSFSLRILRNRAMLCSSKILALIQPKNRVLSFNRLI